MTSFAISPFTLPAALAVANGALDLDKPTWMGDSADPLQAEFLENFRRRAAIAAALDEIAANATTRIDEHVAWLLAHDFVAQVSPGLPTDLYLAAVLSIGGRWVTSGRSYRQGEISRAHLKQDLTVLISAADTTRDYNLARIATDALGVEFWVQQTRRDFSNDRAGLLSFGRAMVVRNASEDSGEVDFPMIDLKVRTEAKHLIGIHSGPHRVSQALEQLTLQLNHLGGMAKAAAEMVISRGFSSQPKVVINGPFVTAVTKAGCDEPLFVAYCDVDSWKEPDLKV